MSPVTVPNTVPSPNQEHRFKLAKTLDYLIVSLMIAILLTLTLPVCRLLRSAPQPRIVPVAVPSPSVPTVPTASA